MENVGVVSVIIPMYNKEKNIARTIDSVLAQDYPWWELVVVDDGSSDGSVSVVEQYEDDRIRLFRKENGGVSAARNYGVQTATGEYVVYLDADDSLVPSCLLTLLDVLKKYQVDVAVGNVNVCNGKHTYPFFTYPREGRLSKSLRSMYLMDVVLRTGNYVLRRETALLYPFNEALARYEDYEHVIRLLKDLTVAYTPRPVMTYMLDNLGLSVNHGTFEKDFISCMPCKSTLFWEKMLYGFLLEQGLRIYPEKQDELLKKYSRYVRYMKYGRMMSDLLRWRRSWHKSKAKDL